MSTEPVLTPKRPPSATHEVIVVTETLYVGWEDVRFPSQTHETLVYHNTVPGRDDIAARIREASIIVCTVCPLRGEVLAQAPYLKCIISHPVGTDHIDIEYCRQHNIQVMNCTGCNTQTVAEHAISLYFATRRSLVPIHNIINDFAPGRPNEWKAKGSLIPRVLDANGQRPRTCGQEIAGIIGYGAVGQRIAGLCTALGMRVFISDRKDASSSSSSSSTTSSSPLPPSTTTSTASPPPHRIPFTQVLRNATVLFLTLPLLPSTRSLLAAPEFRLTRPDAVLVNVSRGGIVDEAAVLAALRSRDHLFGYGTDVLAVEPAGATEDSVLLLSGSGAGAGADDGGEARALNLVISGHQAWVSETTLANQKRRVGENLRWFVEGEEGRGDVVVPRRRA